VRAIFADTFYFLALINARDEAHEAAVTFSRDTSMRLVTTAWVLMEIADGLAARAGRGLFPDLLDTIRSDPKCRLIGFSQPTFEQAVRLYRDRPDKLWSLTDCTSFAVMKRLRLSEALTADHHFAEAGFRPLLA
jgi:predicted nucleic acid-binding protein